MQKPDWTGVFPAATTQFAPDMSVDFDATAKVQAGLIDDGVDGMVVLGTVGENNSLSADEKLEVLKTAVKTVQGRRPVIAGVSELTTDRAVEYVKNAEKIGVNGLMVLPAMVYVPTEDELVAHFTAIARATSLPIMLYNNPVGYRVNISLDALERLSSVENIVAIKESAPDSRRITDVINRCGDRYIVFAGLDDVAAEGLMLGAQGWVSGLTNAFPEESVALVAALREKNYERALEIYRWFMPLLHLDADHDLVQSIKLAEEMMGRGSSRVRMPRMPLSGDRLKYVESIVRKAAETRPVGKSQELVAG
jgi:4-hydroxy-tetrahydrodipicolinate synthase